MNLHLLRIFHTVGEHASFSRAAEHLGISQPAVSKALRELEDQLDVVLIERGARIVSLTEAGQVLFEYAGGIFAMERAALEALQAYSNLERGRLRIGASMTVAGYWLPGYVADFAQAHPGITLSLISANTQTVADRLLACDVDIALVEGPVEDERIESRPWRDETLLIVAPPDSALAEAGTVSAADLSKVTWVVREHGSGTREVMNRWLDKLGIVPTRTIEAGSTEAVIQTVAAGGGVSMVPRVSSADQIALGKVATLTLPGVQLTRQLYRLRLPRRPLSPAALAFEAMIATD
jgi:DNA-binding transcriptional LysR family regulator